MSRIALDWDRFDRLAEAFLLRFRQGEHLSVQDYAREHPELAKPIQEFFPTLLALERLQRGPNA